MKHEDFRPLRERSFRFALDVAAFCHCLPRNWAAWRVRDQLFRSATSVAANYRAASRSRSPSDFMAKINTVVEEADECAFWLTFLIAAEIITSTPEYRRLELESGELLAIFAASLATAKRNAREKAKARLCRR
jgi:four helix bundle protein